MEGHKWQLADLDESEKGYLAAKNFYEKSRGQILDATVNGKLKIFQKITFEEALKIAVPKNK